MTSINPLNIIPPFKKEKKVEKKKFWLKKVFLFFYIFHIIFFLTDVNTILRAKYSYHITINWNSVIEAADHSFMFFISGTGETSPVQGHFWFVREAHVCIQIRLQSWLRNWLSMCFRCSRPNELNVHLQICFTFTNITHKISSSFWTSLLLLSLKVVINSL